MSPKVTTPQQDLIRGIWRENPVLVQLLGLCPLRCRRPSPPTAPSPR